MTSHLHPGPKLKMCVCVDVELYLHVYLHDMLCRHRNNSTKSGQACLTEPVLINRMATVISHQLIQ